MECARDVARLLLLAVLVPFAGCRAAPYRDPGDSTVRLHTSPGGELGVSTEYGVVFLGQGKRSGEVEFTAWFGDGPSLETGIVEPLGGGLFLTRSEIRIPTVGVSFVEPRPGERVSVSGREGRDGRYRFSAVVTADERVEGMLLRANGDLRELGPEQVGAGVYVERDGRRLLVGLLSGRLRLPEAGGAPAGDFYTVVGPRELWRLIAYPRDLERHRLRAHRGDVLP